MNSSKLPDKWHALRKAAEAATPGKHQVRIALNRGVYRIESEELYHAEHDRIDDGLDGGSVTTANRDYFQMVVNPAVILELLSELSESGR